MDEKLTNAILALALSNLNSSTQVPSLAHASAPATAPAPAPATAPAPAPATAPAPDLNTLLAAVLINQLTNNNNAAHSSNNPVSSVNTAPEVPATPAPQAAQANVLTSLLQNLNVAGQTIDIPPQRTADDILQERYAALMNANTAPGTGQKGK